jgi:hypothetical protein
MKNKENIMEKCPKGQKKVDYVWLGSEDTKAREYEVL